MKKFFFSVTLCFFSIALNFSSISQVRAENSISIPLSINYASTYWWRGIELNGRSVGVLWLGAGIELGNTGFSLNVNSGLSQDYLCQGDEGQSSYEEYHNAQKAKSEFDYGLSYDRTIAEIFSFTASLYYINYPFYDSDSSLTADPSFIEASLALGIKTLLSPKLTVYYDYYIEESDAKTPVNEDYYVNFALSQPIVDADGFTFTLGGWIGYYNNAYLDASGFSDAGVSMGFGYSKGNATYNSTLYYARSLTKDFQIEYENVGVLKNHLWVEFEVIYKL